MKLPERVQIVEVGPRDGLQSEERAAPLAAKLRFLEALADAGLREIEASSFVHPQVIPQLADADELFAALPAREGVVHLALVPNERGLDRALEAGVRRIAVFTSASDSFARKNIRMGIEESFAVFGPLVARALEAGCSVRGYLSASFVCPYEGDIAPEVVRPLAERLLALGCDEVSISDIIGVAAPREIEATVGHLLERIPPERIALHLHDSCGTALANVLVGLEMGITRFDTAAGGLGGCPYAPGAPGNLATEDLVYLLERCGVSTGVDLAGVIAAGAAMAEVLGRRPSSHLWRHQSHSDVAGAPR